MRTAYYYDFEFLDDGKTIEPISLGIVSGLGPEFYWVNNTFDWNRESEQMTWLKKHVRPHINPPPPPEDGNKIYYLSSPVGDAAATIHTFLSSAGDPILWGYYSAYDHVTLAQMFGPMAAWPFRSTMLTYDVKQFMDWFDVRKHDPLMPKGDGLHNALSDARWVRDACHRIAQSKFGCLDQNQYLLLLGDEP